MSVAISWKVEIALSGTVLPSKSAFRTEHRLFLRLPSMAINKTTDPLVLLKPFLAASGSKATGRVAIGTVQGDLHDIGKNLVGMMLEGVGFEIVDFGYRCAARGFCRSRGVQTCRYHCPLCIINNNDAKDASDDPGAQSPSLRDKVKVIIGGAPVTEAYAQQISADGYAPDASAASRLATRLMAGFAPEAAKPVSGSGDS